MHNVRTLEHAHKRHSPHRTQRQRLTITLKHREKIEGNTHTHTHIHTQEGGSEQKICEQRIVGDVSLGVVTGV